MERLTDDRFLKDGFYQPKSKDEEKEIRSMGSDLTFEKLYRHCAEVEKENAELQKQVGELKKRLVDEFEAFKVEAYGKVKQQAVKDTAKEIYHLIDMFPIPTRQGQQRYATGFENGLTAIKLKMAERYGVEVGNG